MAAAVSKKHARMSRVHVHVCVLYAIACSLLGHGRSGLDRALGTPHNAGALPMQIISMSMMR